MDRAFFELSTAKAEAQHLHSSLSDLLDTSEAVPRASREARDAYARAASAAANAAKKARDEVVAMRWRVSEKSSGSGSGDFSGAEQRGLNVSPDGYGYYGDSSDRGSGSGADAGASDMATRLSRLTDERNR